MKPVLRLRRRVRLRIALLAIIALLFQQTALASYVCSLPAMPTGDTAMMEHCDHMPMAQTPNDPALCAAHCAQTPLSVPSVSSPQVPPLVLPAILPADLQFATVLPPAASRYVHDSPHRSQSVSPELRFDVLLI